MGEAGQNEAHSDGDADAVVVLVIARLKLDYVSDNVSDNEVTSSSSAAASYVPGKLRSELDRS